MQGRGGGRIGGEHDGYLVDTLLAVELTDAGDGAAFFEAFGHLEMLVGLGGNLRKVRDGYDLHVACHLAHDASHSHGDIARDAAVDLIEDDGGQQVALGDDRLDGKHETRELAARGDVGNRTERAALVGVEEELDAVVAHEAEVGGGGYLDDDACQSHAQLCQHGGYLLLQEEGCLLTAGGELVGGLLQLAEDVIDLLHDLADAVVEAVGLLEGVVETLLDSEELVDGGDVVLLLKTVDEVEALVDEVLPLRRELELVVERSHLGEEVLQLDDGGVETLVEGVDVGMEGGDVGETAAGSDKARDGAVLVIGTAIAEGGDGAEGLFDGTRMFEEACLLFQSLLLVGLELGGLELVEEEAVVVVGLAVLSILSGELFELVLEGSILAVERLIGGQRQLVGEGVEQLGLEEAVGEGEGLILRMDVEDVDAQLFEELHAGGRIVDEGAALGRGEDLATDDEVVVIVGIVLVEERLEAEA